MVLLAMGPATALSQTVLKGETEAIPSPIGPIPRYPITFIVGNLEGSKPVSSLIQESLRINGLTPLTMTTLATQPGFNGPVLALTARVSSMYGTYPDPFVPFEQEYMVTGLYQDGVTPFAATGIVAFFTVRAGDVNGDAMTDIADLVSTIDYLFVTNLPPSDIVHADMNRDGKIEISDVTLMVGYVFGF